MSIFFLLLRNASARAHKHRGGWIWGPRICSGHTWSRRPRGRRPTLPRGFLCLSMVVPTSEGWGSGLGGGFEEGSPFPPQRRLFCVSRLCRFPGPSASVVIYTNTRGSAPLTLSTSAPTRLGCSRCLRGVLEGVPLRNHGVSDAVACSRETGRLLVNGSPMRVAKRHSICPPCSGDMHMQHAARSSALPHTHSLMLPLLVRSAR